ncbi:mitochondrial fission ELM1 family protein [Luteimonas suaedae]|uniref:mitochondrial fission ELM1 family protein n=1 Tax=Luteimonas suaedae TaxID=2605430 RepID=UPI0011EE65D5|nr:mitochondrial fission ELM1 family protein [Luteimonas suaedae]
MQCWAVSDGRAGNLRQAEALARALAPAAVRDWRLAPRAPWRWAAPRRLPGSEGAFGGDFAAALSAPPTLAVGCGRQAALATRLLRAHGARTVQILDPRLDPAHWDLVVVPEHDGLRGDNVVTLLGSLHPVDDAWLARARTEFAAFADLPRPRTALLLGGSSRHARFDRTSFEALASRLDAALARDGGSVLLTASRRTPPELRDALRGRYANTPGIAWLGGDDGPNPYPGLLAWADRIVCSPDSVNMISEACATRAPVFVPDPARVSGRPRRFLDTLLARGRIRAMDASLASFKAEPLRETARVAAEVRSRLALP